MYDRIGTDVAFDRVIQTTCTAVNIP